MAVHCVEKKSSRWCVCERSLCEITVSSFTYWCKIIYFLQIMWMYSCFSVPTTYRDRHDNRMLFQYHCLSSSSSSLYINFLGHFCEACIWLPVVYNLSTESHLNVLVFGFLWKGLVNSKFTSADFFWCSISKPQTRMTVKVISKVIHCITQRGVSLFILFRLITWAKVKDKNWTVSSVWRTFYVVY